MNKLIMSAVAAASIMSMSGVYAYEGGDIVARFGLTSVNPNDESENVILGGESTDLTVGVDNDVQLGLNLVYFFNSSIALELLAATPFTHTIELNDGDGNTTELAEVTHLPPTVSALYYLPISGNGISPYLGAGINYTVFFDEEFTSQYRDAGFADLSLDSSLGLAVQAGVDIELDDRWHINTSIRYIDIQTTADFKVGEADASVEVELNPWVYTLSAGYRF